MRSSAVATLEMLADVYCKAMLGQHSPARAGRRDLPPWRRRCRDCIHPYVEFPRGNLDRARSARFIGSNPSRIPSAFGTTVGAGSPEVGVIYWLLVATYTAQGKVTEASTARSRAQQLLPTNRNARGQQ